jgi:peptide deformylase
MVSSYSIVQLGDELLRRQAQPVQDFGVPEFADLVAEMMRLMQAENGVGIAAPQLGVALQVLIVASRPTPRYPDAPQMAPLLMVNPRFEITDAALRKDWEGCLSVPGIRALVPRHRALQVRFQDAEGRAQQIDLDEFPARVFQHEYDHLIGLVYLDRVEQNRDIVAESEFFKRIQAAEVAA